MLPFKLVMGNWNTTQPWERARAGQESQMILPECCWHGISLNKHHGCITVELDDGWKFFYFGIEPEMFSQNEMGRFVSPQPASYADEWIAPGGWVEVEVVLSLPVFDTGIHSKPAFLLRQFCYLSHNSIETCNNSIH